MQLFEVVVTGHGKLLIKAETAEEANEIAIEEALLRWGDLYRWEAEVHKAPPHAYGDVELGISKPSSQTCEHCSKTSSKTAWGPGYVTCPACGRHPKTPLELTAEARAASETKWKAVDLDRTLAHHDVWRGIEYIGDPIPEMLERVKGWLAEGVVVKIFTARVCGTDGRDVDEVRGHIERWCLKHLGVVLPVTNVKDFSMEEIWDDRAVQVEPNTGRRVGHG